MLQYVLELPVRVPLRAAELGLPCVGMLGDEPKHPLKAAPGKEVREHLCFPNAACIPSFCSLRGVPHRAPPDIRGSAHES